MFERWDYGFKSRSKFAFSVAAVLSCPSTDLAVNRAPIQGVLTDVQGFIVSELILN
jgi:hypothetical protein